MHHFSLRARWLQKFRIALRGALLAARTQSSFAVQLLAALTVIVVAAILSASVTQWCVLILCITIVLAAEAFNTSLEHLARAVSNQPSDEIRDALDVAAGAVLIASIGALIVGAAIFAERLFALFG